MKKRVIMMTLLALVFCLSQVTASFAQDKATPAKVAEAKAPAAKAGQHAGRMHAANTVAVCGCGKVFVPDANTKYIEHGGKEYACCSEGCHKMAEKNPEGTAKMAEENMAKLMNPPAAKPAAPAEQGK